ncbi:DUF1835 domain-containing protein [Niallia circulans]|uniref:DUF1835 domain-containing protein n=2 Tax=Niallia circulans TaxID=1397 RepID=UPI003981E078
MIHKLIEYVENTSEEEVRSLLFLILLQISVEEQPDEELAKSLRRTYQNYLQAKTIQPKIENKRDYKVVHIAFGESAAGSLRMALKEMGVQDEEKVICFSDNFSFGPLWKIEEEMGLALRHKWLINHINYDEKYLFSYKRRFYKTILEVKNIKEHAHIFIWAGENADEQTAQRFVLSLLQNKTNDIFLINPLESYEEIAFKSDVKDYAIHTGLFSSEELQAIYQKNNRKQPLTMSTRFKYINEWKQISQQNKNLRIWADKKINSVAEDYYDNYIIKTAKLLHKEQNSADFIKSARLIGEIIGNLNQRIGDIYFEYRLIRLVLKGIFELEGVPKAMRYYSVKLQESYLY